MKSLLLLSRCELAVMYNNCHVPARGMFSWDWLPSTVQETPETSKEVPE